jgi:FMN-dependent dehydrogenase
MFILLSFLAAAQKMAHPDGEVATSKACATAGISMSLSSVTNSTIEEVVSAAEGKIDHTLQIYLGRNREGLKRIIRQAESESHCSPRPKVALHTITIKFEDASGSNKGSWL